MIIVYGKNSNDITILHKYDQLVKLGFTNVHIYTGGIFEWMLLHEIYGKDLFKITKYEIDILRYRPKSVLLAAMSGGGGGHGALGGGGSDGFGGYIEDAAGTISPNRGSYHQNEDDFRMNIPPNENDEENSDGNHSNTNGTINLLSTGIKWLFGS